MAELQLQVGNDRTQVGIPAAFAQTIDRPLHLRGARLHGADRVGDGHLAVVVAVDADRDAGEAFADHAGDLVDFVRETAAVGVAQHQAVGAGLGRGGERAQGIVGVGLVAVEEVLGVVHQFLALLLQIAHRVGDHRHVFVERGAQDFEHLIVPALAENGDGGGARLEQRPHIGILGDGRADLARRAESNQARMGQLEVCGAREELQVLRVRTGIARFDVGDTQRVEPLDDLELVLDGIGNSLRLSAVAQGRVVDVDVGHGNSRGSFGANFTGGMPVNA